jgi:hypothetical protein
MGTRHLIAAVIDGDFRIAQYGQWDGYPSGQGKDVLNFLAQNDLDEFRSKLRNVQFMNKEEIAQINNDPEWSKKYPWLSRNAGSDVLRHVSDADGKIKLIDKRGFAGDGLFCEWAYVIDFDNDKFEIYEGFKRKPTPPDSRFPSGAEWLEQNNEYSPVHLKATYDFFALPTNDEFVAALESSDDEEDEAE